MAGKKRRENNPGNYTADIWGNEQEQSRQRTRSRRGKNGIVLVNGVSFSQEALFHGEEVRIPFPAAPVNKIPDRLGMTKDPGTLFSLPLAEPQHAQAALFEASPATATTTSPQSAAVHNTQEAAASIKPMLSAEEKEQNPLLAILNEDEIYVDPNEVTIEEAEENGYPLLRRDVVTYKWWLEFPFDTREQPELYKALLANKWKWGGYRQQWFNPSHFPELPKNMPYANAGGASYSEENAERIEARATKARAESSAHYERSNQLVSIIPFGQPMMPDHYSYRSDLAYRKKIWRQMDLFVEFYKKAEWLENRAEGSRRLQRRTSNFAMMQNRLDTLQKTLRSVRRNYQEAKATGESYLDYYRYRMTILAGEILPLQTAIAESGGLPIEKQEAERPLQPGDYILIHGHPQYVEKVNQKTITCSHPTLTLVNGKPWLTNYKKTDFQKVLATIEELEAGKHQEQQE